MLTRPALAFFALAIAAAAPAWGQDTLPPGNPIEEGVGADITEEGFDTLLGLVGDFIPPDLVIGSIPEQDVDLFFCTENLQLDNLVIHTAINSITVDGTPSGLVLVADIDVWINTPDDPAIVTLAGCIDDVCLLHTDPATIVVEMPITLALSADEAGDPFIDVTLGALSHNISDAMSNTVHMTGCAIGEINEFLSDVGLNLFDLVIDQFVGEIEAQIEEQTASLEETIEDALRALWLADTLDALGTELTYDIHPTAVEHNDFGLRLVLGGMVAADPAQCIARYDNDGSAFTPSNMPGMTELVPGSGNPYHAAVLLSDDLVAQAAHAAWRGGVLCYVVEDLGGTALSTTYLGLLLGLDLEERLQEILGAEETPMLIRTVPESPPVVTFDGDHDINIEFYPVILDRFSRLAAIAIDVNAGLDISMAPDDALQLDIFLDAENLNPRVTYNEIAPDLNEALEANFTTFAGTIIDTVAGSALEGMAFGLPTFSGIGLTELEVLAVGESPSLLDFLGVYATLGETTGGESSGGCDSCGGDAGCADGCGGDSCGGEEGCDAETLLEDSGCTGEATEQPSDVGCTGCRHLRAKRMPDGHYRITIDPEGVQHHRTRRTLKVGVAQVLLVLGPILVLVRRRRRPDEF